MVLPLKLVSFNTYLVSRHFNQNRVTHLERRASRIQSFLQCYDLCFLQEVWGSGFAELTVPSLAATSKRSEHTSNPILAFDLPPWRRPFLGNWIVRSTLVEWVYTIYLHMGLQTGGLHDMVRPQSAKCTYRSKHTFSKSRSKSLKGVEATYWTNIMAWDGRFNLLVFNTHLDPWMVDNRTRQVQEIFDFMQHTMNQIQMQETSESKCMDWSQTAVLLLGDFNILADSDEYHALVNHAAGRCKDFFALANTNGNVTDMVTYDQRNSLVTSPNDHGRIDYIFGIDEFQGKTFLSLRCLQSDIIRQSPGEELSDHYPIMVQIIPDKDTNKRHPRDVGRL